jgi:predicted alpha/beta hydrolase family esterase
MKQQVFVIHGGETFESYEEYLEWLKTIEVSLEREKIKGWKQTLSEDLGDGFEVILPEMPNPLNAKYLEWKIYFDKYIPYFQDNVILIGHSLGAIFLAKYLSENIFPKKLKAVFLLAPPYDDVDAPYSLADFTLPADLSKIGQQTKNLFLYHSKDDPVVAFQDCEKYMKALPKAKTRIFEDKQHFIRVPLPELVEDIRNLT